MSSRRVMIVEDESLVAEDLHMCLEKLGYEVVGIADSADSALRMASECHPDLALLDIRLKGERDGIDVAGKLQRDRIGFVYLTSHADAGTLARAKVTEPLGYVLKPFDPRELSPVLEMALYKHDAEVRLHTMERWLATTLHSIGDGVVVADKQRRISYLNPAAEQIVGWSIGDAVGTPVTGVLKLVDLATSRPLECVVARALATNRTVHLQPDAALVTKDGRVVPIDDCAAPVRTDGGEVTGAVVVFRDATEIRRLRDQERSTEQRLEDARRLQSLGVLAAGLAHDLNNVLTSILGNVALCREGAGVELHPPLDEIESNAHAAAALCRQLLNGAGAGPLDRRRVDFTAVIVAAVARERALAPETLQFDVDCTGADVEAFVDPVQLGQVVANLLRNAAEAIGDRPGTITVRTGMEPGTSGTLWVEVGDNGAGMPEEVRRRVFEPFFSTKFAGRGLGLASVHGIVARHGGRIDVTSAVGKGTTFRVHWPMPSGTEAGQGREPQPSGMHGRTIAVVDDDASVRQITCRLIQSFGCIGVEMTSGQELLEALRRGDRLDGVVLDMMMPDKTGEETLCELRVDWPDLPVVMVSGHADMSGLALRNDARLDCLAKPFDIGDLCDRLSRLIAGRANSR